MSVVEHLALQQRAKRILRRYERFPRWSHCRLFCLLCFGVLLAIAPIVICSAAAVLMFYWGITHFDDAGWVGLGAGCILLPVAIYHSFVLFWQSRRDEPGVCIDSNRDLQIRQLIEQSCVATNAARPARVWLTAEYGASVLFRPRFGFFGGNRCELMVGLPLLDCHSQAELTAILTHELGHIKRVKSLPAWIYRLRAMWADLFYQISTREHITGVLMLPFSRWFWPRFNLNASIVSQFEEFQADAVAAQQTSPPLIALALVKLAVVHFAYSELLQPSLNQAVWRSVQPPDNYCQRYRDFFIQVIHDERLERWMACVLSQTTDALDTHPSLRDRLQAIGIDLSPQQWVTMLRQQPDGGAAELLGSRRATLETAINSHWSQSVQVDWGNEHHRKQRRAQERGRLAIATDFESRRQHALATIDLDGPQAALGQWQTLITERPDIDSVSLKYGECLVAADAVAGSSFLETLTAHGDRALAAQATAILAGHYQRCGPADKFEQTVQRMAQMERQTQPITRAGRRSDFAVPSLAIDEMAGLHQRLRDVAPDCNVYVAEMIDRHSTGADKPKYVIGIDKPVIAKAERQEAHMKIVAQIRFDAALPPGTIICTTTGPLPALAKKLIHAARSKPELMVK